MVKSTLVHRTWGWWHIPGWFPKYPCGQKSGWQKSEQTSGQTSGQISGQKSGQKLEQNMKNCVKFGPHSC